MITLGNITRNTNTSLEVEVMADNTVVGTHKFNKDWCSHSFTEKDIMDSNDLLYVFQESKSLVNRLRKEI